MGSLEVSPAADVLVYEVVDESARTRAAPLLSRRRHGGGLRRRRAGTDERSARRKTRRPRAAVRRRRRPEAAAPGRPRRRRARGRGGADVAGRRRGHRVDRRLPAPRATVGQASDRAGRARRRRGGCGDLLRRRRRRAHPRSLLSARRDGRGPVRGREASPRLAACDGSATRRSLTCSGRRRAGAASRRSAASRAA